MEHRNPQRTLATPGEKEIHRRVAGSRSLVVSPFCGRAVPQL